jgi:ubiquitin-like protein Pup
MSERTQTEKPSETQTKQADPKPAEAKDMSKKGEEVKADMDDLIDKIDEVLEENCEQFVKDYVQRGGE